MPHSRLDEYIGKAIKADTLASKATDHESKEGWQKIAASWRLLAERALAERTGGQVLLH